MSRFERFFYIGCIMLLFFSYERSGASHATVLKDFQNGFVSVVKRVTPVVVNISAEGTINRPAIENPFAGTPFEQFFHQFYSPQLQQHFTSLGSGVIVKKDGYILTNAHVIRGASDISVILSNGRTFRHAKVVGTDPTTDLAVIKVNTIGPLPEGSLGNSDNLQVGSWAIAVGNPYGFNSTVTVGVISAKGRNLPVRGENQAIYHNLIQTDASINPGNSGGPLVDIDGNIIGIDTSIATPSGGSVGIGFAIPVNIAKTELAELVTKGKVTHGWLGISMQSITPSLAKAFGVKSGVLVAEIAPSGPAEKAGLKSGDVVVGFNGKTVASAEELQDMVTEEPAGKSATVEIVRNKEHLNVPVILGQIPQASTGESSRNSPKFGLHLEGITPELAQTYHLRQTSGLVVVDVDRNSLAAQAQIVPGDVILEVNRTPVKTVEQFEQLVKSQAGPTLFLVQHEGTNRFVALYFR